MSDLEEKSGSRTLLVFNCHESWVYQLGALGVPLDIIVGLKGRYTSEWDERIRPIPPNGRLITLAEAQRTQREYHCIITHNITDLLDVKHRTEPKLLVIHATIEGRALTEKSRMDLEQMKRVMHRYVHMIGAHVTAVSELKGRSLGFAEDIVPFGADPDDYPVYTGAEPCGLRVSNFVNDRRQILLWELHEAAFGALPVRIVGHNPDMPGVAASENWQDLKRLLQGHRFFIHTADPRLEDGCNMATMEAMAAGMPIVGNRHPGSPIVHGVSGFLSDDPDQLRRHARRLLDDRDLAVRMGKASRRTVVERFSMEAFAKAFLNSIEQARTKNRMHRK